MSSKLISNLFLVLLTASNIVIGMLVSMLMFGSEYIQTIIELQKATLAEPNPSLFLSVLINPALGTLYTALYIGLSVYQSKITVINIRIAVHVALLAISVSILLYMANLLNLY